MFSPKKDMKELVLEILKKDPMSISGVSRELLARGVKLHRLELTGYLKALAEMGLLKSRDIKPSKVFSVSASRERNLFELIGGMTSRYTSSPDEHATLAVYTLQKLFRRAIFEMELKRCGIGGAAEGRKATTEERSEAKAILTRLGYKIPNSDVPTIVEKDLEDQFLMVMADALVEALNARGYVRETTQTKL